MIKMRALQYFVDDAGVLELSLADVLLVLANRSSEEALEDTTVGMR